MITIPTRLHRGCSALLMAAAFGACATKAPPPPAAPPAVAQAPAPHAAAPTPAPEQPPPECEIANVYFGYDSSDLDEQAKETLAKNQKCAQQKGASGMKLVGMTDPRGTEEYNLALGDRRARNTARYLGALGAPEPETTSVGAEMAKGSDEGTWAKDRRTEVQLK